MPLLELWASNPSSIEKMNLETIVRMAGEQCGLKDGSEAEREFRTYLSEVDADVLANYADTCLNDGFQGSGQVLQDVVNEIGRRLGFQVTNGRYQGVRGEVGYDGIWSAENDDLVVEVKTTDAYTISLDTIAKYHDRLLAERKIRASSSMLLVIGRKDTTALEAQVRGSRHAWSLRIVGVDALIKLMAINLSTMSDETTSKIHRILSPVEYTRVDDIIDIVFTAAEDRDETDNEVVLEFGASDESEDGRTRTQVKTPRDEIEAKKVRLMSRFGASLTSSLKKTRHSMYQTSDGMVRGVIVISKPYDPQRGELADHTYWYAYHETPQRAFLHGGSSGYVIFGMTNLECGYAVPCELLDSIWDSLGQTTKKSGSTYKHIYIFVKDGKAKLRSTLATSRLPKELADGVDIEQYRF